MARTKQSRGNCVFCGRQMTKSGLAKHLATCAQRKEAVDKVEQMPGKKHTFYHLQIQDAWSNDFWLHLEMRDSASLQDLDSYLRTIWLECCGHLSRFSAGGWDEEEISKRKKAASVFTPGLELLHIYDFWDSSETLIKVIGERKGKGLTEHPIYLMARNEPPEARCSECGEPAAWLCMECVAEETGAPALLCEKHAKPHRDHVLLPLVNSPRTGMCGYEGPAEPPY